MSLPDQPRRLRDTIGRWPDWCALAAVEERGALRQRIDHGNDLARRSPQAGSRRRKPRCGQFAFLRRDRAGPRSRKARENELGRPVYPKLGATPIAGGRARLCGAYCRFLVDAQRPVQWLGTTSRDWTWPAARNQTGLDPLCLFLRASARCLAGARRRQVRVPPR